MTRVGFPDRRLLCEVKKPNLHIQQVNANSVMTRHRFEQIFANISFLAIYNSAFGDRCNEVEGFVREFNRHSHETVSTGESIFFYESISRWYGLGGDWYTIGLLNYIKLEQKTKKRTWTEDLMLWCTRINFHYRITKCVEETKQREYKNEATHGKATILRFVAPWFVSNRNIYADSFFASETTAMKLWDVGLRFTGVVKTATRKFPMSYLSSVEKQRKGDFKSMISG